MMGLVTYTEPVWKPDGDGQPPVVFDMRITFLLLDGVARQFILLRGTERLEFWNREQVEDENIYPHKGKQA